MQEMLPFIRDLAPASQPLAIVLMVFWLLHSALPAATRQDVAPGEAWRNVAVAITFGLSFAVIAITIIHWLS